MENNKEASFNLDEIEDVRVIVKAKGKHYGIVPKKDREEAKGIRIALFSILVDSHFVVSKALEDIDQ